MIIGISNIFQIEKEINSLKIKNEVKHKKYA